MSLAVMFPGQGAATPGLGSPWVGHPSWSVVDRAEQVLDRPIADLLLTATADELIATGASQLAVLVVSLVAWDAAQALLPEEPVVFAGHSLGQITALIAAGIVDLDSGLQLAAARADACQASADRKRGRMAALLCADLATAQAVCASLKGVWVANDNAPGQIVIAGEPQALAAAADLARDCGVRRVTPLAVGHAFHTPMLADAAFALGAHLDGVDWSPPHTPVVTNHDALICTAGDGWADRLARHLVEPVRWRGSIEVCTSQGVDRFLECGPGRVLSALVARTAPSALTCSVAVPAALESIASEIGWTGDKRVACGENGPPPLVAATRTAVGAGR